MNTLNKFDNIQQLHPFFFYLSSNLNRFCISAPASDFALSLFGSYSKSLTELRALTSV